MNGHPSLRLLVASALLLACDSTTAPSDFAPDRALRITVRATSQAQWSLAAAAPSRTLAQAAASDVTALQIQEVFLVLGGLKLETAGLDETLDWVLDESVVIPLDLTGNPTLAFATDVPVGLYKELEVSVDKLEDGNPMERSLIASFPELSNASILARGSLAREGGGLENWEFATDLDVDLELPFDMLFEATGDATAYRLVSLTLDLKHWLETPAGPLDPTDPANRSEIESRIQDSMEVLEES